MVWDRNSGHLLLTNENSIAITNIGSVDEIDPRLGYQLRGGPVGRWWSTALSSPNCMPTGITQGPGNNFLVGCADHDGEAFPPNEYIITIAPGNAIKCATTPLTNCVQITTWVAWTRLGTTRATTDTIWRRATCSNGPVMGVIDAKTNLWLDKCTTGSNAHSIAVDPSTNHAFVPLAGGSDLYDAERQSVA